MHAPVHPLKELFQQLGLGSSNEEVEVFIHMHAPLRDDIQLADAPFWSPSQAAFLREALNDDDDWCEVIDELNRSLHQKRPQAH